MKIIPNDYKKLIGRKFKPKPKTTALSPNSVVIVTKVTNEKVYYKYISSLNENIMRNPHFDRPLDNFLAVALDEDT